jgi:hypothetical protein
MNMLEEKIKESVPKRTPPPNLTLVMLLIMGGAALAGYNYGRGEVDKRVASAREEGNSIGYSLGYAKGRYREEELNLQGQ